MSRYRVFSVFSVFSVLFVLAALAVCGAHAKADAGNLPKSAHTTGGLVVCVGCDEPAFLAALPDLAGGKACRVLGLDTDAARVAAARKHLLAKGVYGTVCADVFDGKSLPFTDNLVNLLVVRQAGTITREEMLRVLAPLAAAYVCQGQTWTKIDKPWPKDIDEWTHYLHDPGNNAVAKDTVVGPPRHLQWLAEPLWSRNHHKLNSVSSVVTTRGRLFAILDEASSANINLPSRWRLVARDAFSGVTLWKKPLPSWAVFKNRFRSGPPQLPRLLVARGERVYAPLGLGAAVSALDAATGKVLQTYQATKSAEEIVLAGDVLLVVTGSPAPEQAAKSPVFAGTYKFPNRKSVVAVSTTTGKQLWRWSPEGGDILPETLAADDSRVYMQVSQSIACLDRATGKPCWTFGRITNKPLRRRLSFGTHVLVVVDDVVLCQFTGELTALAADTGKKLWECKGGQGFHAPLDVFVIDGLVWFGDHPRDSVAPPPVRDFSEGRDLHTGEVKRTNTVMVDIQSAGHHHRCYREKATSRYILTGKRGIEMEDLIGQNHSRNNWVRGTCQYGIMPANGLIYAPPHACGCYMESLLWGFYALSAKRPVTNRRVADGERLHKGPAYAALQAANLKSPISNPKTAALATNTASTSAPGDSQSGAWPTLRQNAGRSGVAATKLPATIAPAWSAKIGGKLTQPVSAAGKVLVAAIDRHTLYAFDIADGKAAWTYTAGGRIDSAPTICGGLVLFGSADGRVTCLRLADGQVVWQFLAAPADVRAVARDQVESLWPVHGSVLVHDGVAYFAAGRSTWLDGGMQLWGLDPASGRIVCQSHYESTPPVAAAGKDKAKPEYHKKVAQNVSDYKTYLQPDKSDSFSMAGGCITDIMTAEGHRLFLHQAEFDEKLHKQPKAVRHLFSTSSLLDDAENHRSHWVFGTGDFSMVPVAYSWIVNRPGGRFRPGIAVPTGLIMVYDRQGLWVVRRGGDANGKYSLLRWTNTRPGVVGPPKPDFRKDKGVFTKDWQESLPVRPRAMLKAGERLVLAVMPADIPPDDPHAAYDGREGGAIWLVAATDGAKQAEISLDSPVIWDGLSAAAGRLYAVTYNGTLRCFAAAK